MRGRKQIVIGAVIVLSAVAVYAKKQTPPPEKNDSASTNSEVVAYMGNEPITRDELNKVAASQLMQVRQKEYDILNETVQQLALQKTMDKEAAARGITSADLMKVEVDDKAAKPTKEDIDAQYEKNKARYGNRTREDVGPEIEKTLVQQRVAERRAAYFKELKDKAQLRVLLEPPRVAVSAPATEPAKGPAAAPVTIVEFSDFQCPYCKRAETIVDQLLQSYPDKVRLVYRDFPLSFHNRALFASQAARCAGEQNKYWEYHDNLMSQTVTGDLGDADLKKRAEGVGLDVAAFTACYDAKRHDSLIQASMQDGQNVGVTGTPTFFINGRMFVGARPLDEFKSVVEEELARGKGMTTTK
jgi:protein-disulfide isomerase